MYQIGLSLNIPYHELMHRLEKSVGKGRIRWLDIGCGYGDAVASLAKEFPRIEAHGIGIARLPSWKTIPNVRWKVAHANKTGYRSNFFDAVQSYFGLTHSADVMSGLAELHRILRPGGHAFFNIEMSKILEEGRGTFSSRLKKMGFDVLDCEEEVWMDGLPCVRVHVVKSDKARL
ncbi:MAG: class I SAM-dependent methyltransferase [Candidatus Diapherotrites archaeon]|nr:class I SAM-dependent methyltransferase [Candidatus Diapherotrites archaeon]